MMEITFLIQGIILFGVPTALGAWRGIWKWGAIALSTVLTPILMLGSIKLTAKIYWALYPGTGSGCSGGECGGEAFAAGFWPLLIPVFMVPAFVVSLFVILLMRRTRA